MRKKIMKSLPILFGLFVIFSSIVQAQQSAADAKGGADHPLISRYTGSQLIAWSKVNFAEVKLLKMLTDDIAAEKKLDKTLTVRGELTELFYVSPKTRTALEVQDNYETALKKAGAQLIYRCLESDWGCVSRGESGTLLLDGIVPREQQIKTKWGAYTAFGSTNTNGRFAILKITRNGADTYVSIYSSDVPTDTEDFGNSASTYIQIIEPKKADQGMVTVDVNALTKEVQAAGKVTLAGLFFDSAKSSIKLESKPQLDEMAKFLKTNAAMNVYIVGHTDNQGALNQNLSLSLARAQAVVDALVKDYGIEAKRLAAAGVASYSPVASNNNEAGRAKNRRVELVLQ
jgi:OmpA-OmpF porin, OOP family